MAIDEYENRWVGSEPEDIEEYLIEYSETEAAYPATEYRTVKCNCGSIRFRLVRSCALSQRTCTECGEARFISRGSPEPTTGFATEAWEEAIEDEKPEPYKCFDCGSEEANLGLGFAAYENPELDAIQWVYVGVRCASCGILDCFNDSKVAWGPADEVYRQLTEGAID